MHTAVILPAAGEGRRFAAAGVASASKIEFEIAGKPGFLHAIEAFRAIGAVGPILLAVHPDRLDEFRFRWDDRLAFHDATLIPGGRVERWETVKLALDHLDDPSGVTHVAVHDAARPAVSADLIERVFAAAERYAAVAPGLPVSSTLKRVGDPVSNPDAIDDILGGSEHTSATASPRPVLETVPRDHLYAIQTPQVFTLDLLRRAYAQLAPGIPATAVTDDAGVVEALGEPVHVVEGDPANLKLTHPGDAALLEALLAHHRQKQAEQQAIVDLFGDDDE
ncbi:MAG: IspD/TarI family cytidylyltransferase [Planctomycetota bacterium]